MSDVICNVQVPMKRCVVDSSSAIFSKCKDERIFGKENVRKKCGEGKNDD